MSDVEEKKKLIHNFGKLHIAFSYRIYVHIAISTFI